MRIAFLLYQFPALSETFILRQIVGLLEMGHEVHIFAERPCEQGAGHPDVVRHKLLDRTTYVRMPAESGLYEMPIWPVWGATWSLETGDKVANIRRLLRCLPTAVRCFARHPRLTCEVLTQRHYDYQAASLSALYRLAALSAERGQFDVLHAHFGPVGRSFRFAPRLWNAPLVVSFHGYDFSTWPRRHGRDAYASLFQNADIVTVHTQFAEDRLRALGSPSALLRRLECGIDPDDFPFQERSLRPGQLTRLLTVARLVEKKGIEYSLRAVAKLVKEGHELHYEIVGDGPLRDKLMALRDSLGVAEHVEFVGAKNNSYVRERMADCDLFVLASVTAADGDTEGAPVSLLEAQACGIPVVSTQHAGIPEIVADNVSGRLVNERDSDAIADAICDLIRRVDSWAAMGARGRAFVEEHHNIRRLNQRMVEIYSEAIAKRAAPISTHLRTHMAAAVASGEAVGTHSGPRT
jgi:colanic acid/amylovoran biosynthesis glycosyltransferase